MAQRMEQPAGVATPDERTAAWSASSGPTGAGVQEDITRKLAEFEKQAIAGLSPSDRHDVLEHSLMS